MVEGSSSQDDGVVVGPFRGVAPGTLQGIPEVAPGRVAHDPLREAPPYQEGKVHLQVQIWNIYTTFSGILIFFLYIYICVQFCCVFITNTCTHTSLVSRTVSSSRLSTASVSMATWGRNRLVVWERNTVVNLISGTVGYMLSGLCLEIFRANERWSCYSKSRWVTEMSESL